MTTQKFDRGDLVLISNDIPAHFPGAGQKAIVIGSYFEQYGGPRDDRSLNQYTLHIESVGECSWYSASELSLLQKNASDLLAQWKEATAQKAQQESDLDWIFANGKVVSASGPSIAALAANLGIENLWGAHGEGISYYANAMHMLTLARPFLLSHDKAGWLAFCEVHRGKITAHDYVISGT